MAQEDIRMKQTWHLSPAASKSSHRRGSDLPEGSGPFSHVELSSRPCFDCYSLLPAGNGTACRRCLHEIASINSSGLIFTHKILLWRWSVQAAELLNNLMDVHGEGTAGRDSLSGSLAAPPRKTLCPRMRSRQLPQKQANKQIDHHRTGRGAVSHRTVAFLHMRGFHSTTLSLCRQDVAPGASTNSWEGSYTDLQGLGSEHPLCGHHHQGQPCTPSFLIYKGTGPVGQGRRHCGRLSPSGRARQKRVCGEQILL
ncbi:hypothetical protein AV530_018862 [Patagioenas fasciata monilis]|uniref:Uncharacterized protein n=1 Tax=Patagioenas fasciata monilis TaxID=372326 RepID=A0A1V4JK08_PATFA|nr:hypothetical protein AV530_018862 [Patagioenas fasciata monilis]